MTVCHTNLNMNEHYVDLGVDKRFLVLKLCHNYLIAGFILISKSEIEFAKRGHNPQAGDGNYKCSAVGGY